MSHGEVSHCHQQNADVSKPKREIHRLKVNFWFVGLYMFIPDIAMAAMECVSWG